MIKKKKKKNVLNENGYAKSAPLPWYQGCPQIISNYAKFYFKFI